MRTARKFKILSVFTALLLSNALIFNKALAEQVNSADLSPKKFGSEDELLDVTAFCGNKPVKVALSDGFGGNAWRKVARKSFESEAAKCPNITKVTYTDAQGNPAKQISDIKSLIAQSYDIIVVFPDAGEALLRTMREGVRAGVAMIPHTTGDGFPGEPGVDYTALATPDQQYRGELWAQWIAIQLGGKGNVVLYGGSPGASVTASQMVGAKKVFDRYPEINILEGPVTTNWDPAQYQKVTTGLLAKYPKIDALFSDYATGVMGALRAFESAGRQLPLTTGVEANELSCYWEKNHVASPGFQFASTPSAATYATKLALRKGLAAVQGIPTTEPSIIREDILIDSTSTDETKAPLCDPNLPPDAAPGSAKLSGANLQELFGEI